MSFAARLMGIRAAETPTRPAPPPQASTQNVGFQAVGSPMTARWNATSAVAQGYYGYLYAYRCARTIATTIAGLPFRAGLNPNLTTEYNPRAPLAALLGPPPSRPAPGISPRQLWAWSLVAYLITGRFGWETVAPAGSSAPAALWPLVAGNLMPIPTDGGREFFSGFEYQANARRRTLTNDQVFYCWRPSQDDWREPESVLQAAALPLSLGVALDRYMSAFMRNNMTGAKMVVTPGFEDTSMRRAFQDQFLAEMTGYDNAGRTAFAEWENDTESGKIPSVQVIDMGTKPVDAQVTEVQKWVRDSVCDAFGVPISIIGQASERTYANADQEHRNYWTGTILPFIEEITDHINIGLAPRLGGEVGWFDLSKVAALKPANKFQAADPVALEQAGIVDAAEIREDMGLATEMPAPGDPEPPEPLPAVDDTPGASTGGRTGGTGARVADGEKVDAAKVLGYLSDNYPQRVLGWVRDASWVHRRVPLEQIKMGRRPGGRDLDKVDAIATAIKSGKAMDPVVLVDTGEDKLEIADGYHRTLATDRADRASIDAYVGSGVGRHGPWEQEMHDAKLNKSDAEKKKLAGARAGVCTGDGPCDTSTTGHGGDNWVTRVGGFPAYYRALIHALKREGRTEAQAVQITIRRMEKWAVGVGVTPATQARAAAALAEFKAKQAASHGGRDGLGGTIVTEASSAAALLPKAGKPMLTQPVQAHLPVAGPVRGYCGKCGLKISAKIHTTKHKRRTSGVRHRGPDGHAHVKTGHDSYARRQTAKQIDAKAASQEPAIEAAVRDVFAAQRKATLDRLNGNRGKGIRSAFDGIRAAGDEQQPPTTTPPSEQIPVMDAGQIFDLTHWLAKTSDALRPAYAALGGLAGEHMSRFGTNDTVREAIAAALQTRSSALAQTVNATTLQQIQDAITNGLAAGDNMGQLTAAIETVFDDAEKTRAPLIARTEAIGALNTAADAHATALGPDVVAGKEWIATQDDRTRVAHREADRQVRAVGVPFTVGGFPMQHPGDPSAPPDEVCNCRCTTGYLTPAEYARRSGVQLPMPQAA